MEWVEDSDREGVQLPEIDLNDSRQRVLTFTEDGKTYKTVKFKESKWNFLDTNGNNLFDESYDFVQPFRRGTTIFKKSGRWGVVTPDTVLIPAKFSYVERLSDVSDTIFKVSLRPQGKRYLDTLTHKIDLPIRGVNRKATYCSSVTIGRKGEF